jgi:hypothetical protein
MGDVMNPLNPTQILRVLENGYFMTHQEQAEAAQYIRQLQKSNETLKGGLIEFAETIQELRQKQLESWKGGVL